MGVLITPEIRTIRMAWASRVQILTGGICIGRNTVFSYFEGYSDGRELIAVR